MTANAQKGYDQQWKKVHEYVSYRQTDSATQVLNDIKNQALKQGDEQHIIKAQLYLDVFRNYNSEDAESLIVESITASIEGTSGLQKAMGHYFLARAYQQYYTQNSWEISQRTNVQDNTQNLDGWTAQTFDDTITYHYTQALVDPTLLKSLKVEDYPILFDADKGQGLEDFSTVYDVMCYAIFGYFSSDAFHYARGHHRGSFDDPRLLARPEKFVGYKIDLKHEKKNKAVEILQDWERFKIETDKPHALKRIYRYQRNYLEPQYYPEDKFQIIEEQLWAMSQDYNCDYEKANFLASKMANAKDKSISTILLSGQPQTMRPLDLRDYHQSVIDAGNMTPHETAIITNLKNQEESSTLRIQIENNVEKDKPILARVEHKNLRNIDFTLYKIERPIEQYIASSELKKIPKQKVRTWTQELNPKIDLIPKSTEIKIDPLPNGIYLLEASGRDGKITCEIVFQASSLVLLSANQLGDFKYRILDRTSGMPRRANTATYYQTVYDDNNLSQLKQIKKIELNGKDKFEYSLTHNKLSADYIKIETDDEIYYSEVSSYLQYPYDPIVRDEYAMYTDRAIYRPGQTVHLGLIAISPKASGEFELIKNTKAEVQLKNLNGEIVETKTIKTDEYGTATVDFTIPETGITGYYYLICNNGSASFRVEEYKRPKFEVIIDGPKQQYKLQDEITILGKGKTYAGTPITDARVQYRVTRSAHLPYYYPYISAPVVIKFGETTTDEKGNFEVIFKAAVDGKISAGEYPLYTYRIEAEITDVSGETRKEEYDYSLSKLPFLVSYDIPSDLDISRDKYIRFSCLTPQGKSTKGSMKLRIHSLVSPDRLYKSRKWDSVSYQSMTEAEFRRDFPDDAYMQEDKIKNWKIKSQVIDETYADFDSIKFDLSKLKKSGAYRVEVLYYAGKDTLSRVSNVFVSDGAHHPDIPLALIISPSLETKVNQAVDLTIFSSLPKPQVHLLDNRDEASLESFILSKNKRIQYKTTESDRGIVNYKVLTWYQNRYYISDARVEVPFTNKQLDIKLTTVKDKTKPGAHEHWTVQVKGKELNQKNVNLMAAMYDKSLDYFTDHRWSLPTVYRDQHDHMLRQEIYRQNIARAVSERYSLTSVQVAEYKIPAFDQHLSGLFRGHMQRRRLYSPVAESLNSYVGAGKDKMVARADAAALEENSAAAYDMESDAPSDQEQTASKTDKIPLRQNLQETAFFYPQLRSDEEGNVEIDFEIPEALTTWRLMLLAHSPDLAVGYAEHEVITQKELMVSPQLPRYLRQQDIIEFAVRVDNLTKSAVEAQSQLKLYDLETDEDLSAKFGIKNAETQVAIDGEGQSVVRWSLHVPADLDHPVRYEITAATANHSDGEKGVLPVVTNRILVTETMPLQVLGNETKNFKFDKRKKHSSATSQDFSYVVEYSGSPLWYAVQSLPYMIDYPYDCSEQIFTKIYASSLAQHIAKSSPDIKKRIELWSQQNPEANKSPLSKNQELKSAILEETPWLRQAKTEEENMRNLVKLFDPNKMQYEISNSLSMLTKRLNGDGGISWFPGGISNEYITTYIAGGIARMQQLGLAKIDGLTDLQQSTRDYIYAQLDKRMKKYIEQNVKSIGNMDIYQMYVLSFDVLEGLSLSYEQKKIHDFFLARIDTQWINFSKSTQAMSAILLHRLDYREMAQKIMSSFDQTAIHSEDRGMYWKDFTGNRYLWYEAPIEGMSLMIAAYEEVSKDQAAADEQRLWLLKHKQVNSWESTKATADATYALLYGNGALEAQPQVHISLGATTVESDVEIPGMEYIKASYQPSEILSDFDDITVQVTDQAEQTYSWGAVYWQYFEDMDKVQLDTDNPLYIEKKVFRKTDTQEGDLLVPVEPGETLSLGDRLTVRLLIRSDRDMEYIHIKDARPGCIEPTAVISSYRGGSLPHYMSTRDISTNFFCDQLRRGSYVLEYDAYVSQAGQFSMGMATVQSMYAPEFGAHSQGGDMTVRP